MSYNRAYHNYFDGYVEKTILDPQTGRTHIQRIYAGVYYRHRLTDRQWKGLKICYCLLYLGCLVCLAVQGLVSPGGNVWYIAVPAVLSVLANLWLGFFVGNYLFSTRELTVGQYKDLVNLKSSAGASVISFVLMAAGQLVWLVLHWVSVFRCVCCLAADAAAVAALLWILRTETDMVFDKRANMTQIPDDAIDIRRRDEDQ